jgi:alpha-methylacyl-CoA racemase
MGPLSGIRIIELASLGPGPFGAMLLGDLGADVIRVDRPGRTDPLGLDRLTCRNRRSIGLNLKSKEGIGVLLDLINTADVLVEGLRPGVVERLGLGPEVCRDRNPGLVYARMTGWGQEGPLRERAGHDINYIALSGALDAIGPARGKPTPPLNLVGDFGGGALYMVMGVLAALVERSSSGFGQVVDAAMVDGTTSLMTMFYEFKAMGLWEGDRGTNLLDGGAPFYDTYETAGGGWMAVGALEPQFFALLLERLGIDFAAADQYDRTRWPELRDLIAAAFLARTREEWIDEFADSDACAWPVLSMAEAPTHRFNSERQVFVDVDGVFQPAPAPRFSRTSLQPPRSAPEPGEHTEPILQMIGLDSERIRALHEAGAVF